MSKVVSVLVRCLAIEFYKQNSAFFGFLILVFLGLIKSSEHITIGTFLVSNPSSLIFLYMIWMVFVAKVIFFVIPTLQKPENQFLEVFHLLPRNQKIWAVFLLSLVLNIPNLFYGLFLVSLSILHSFFISILSIVIALAVLHLFLVSIIFARINKLPYEKKFSQFRVFNKVALPSHIFFIQHLFRNEIVLLALTKVYTILMIVGTASLFSTDQFDLRLFMEGSLLAIVGNVALIHNYVRFNYHDLRIQMNLPVSLVKIYLKHTITILLILLPEILVIIKYYPLGFDIIDILGTLVFCPALALLVFGMMLIKQVELSNFIVQIFWLVVGTTFLILFSIHPLLLASMYILLSAAMVYLRYYKFEFVEKNQ